MMDTQKDYTNLTALIISLLISWITYQYFMDGNYILFMQAVLMGIIFLGLSFLYFIIIRLLIYLIKYEYIYSNFIFITLISFFSFALISLIFYCAIYLEPLEGMVEYTVQLRYYFIKIIPFIAICCSVIGVGLALFFYEVEVEKKNLRKSNVFYLVILLALIISTFFLFYNSYKIEESKLNKEYLSYKGLNQVITSDNYEIRLLMDVNKDGSSGSLSRPYFLANKKEVIINVIVSNEIGNNEPIKFMKIYKINKYGKIIDAIDGMDESNINYVRFPSGYITNFDSTMIVTWIFDGNKTKQNNTDLKPKKDWKIDVFSEDKEALNKVKFFKKFKNKNNSYDGTNYYNINLKNDTLKFKIDSVYSRENNPRYYKKNKIAFYKCNGMNFNLLYDGYDYYIIKRR